MRAVDYRGCYSVFSEMEVAAEKGSDETAAVGVYETGVVFTFRCRVARSASIIRLLLCHVFTTHA
jgi:hypothetical protein